MIRIVKMHFKTESVNDFLELFETAYPKITNMPGNRSLKLLRDIKTPEIMFTYSHWDDEAALENYRNSELFVQTWAKTKALFAQKADAWSLDEV